ncbi:MAG TPA: insulinase family protein [Lachnospiraceae bacterium]|nr:insulinase family protein [Lachnospiraceae bacterium]
MSITNMKEYEVIEERRVSDLTSDGFLLRHRKTGARILLLSNDDNNKVFSIGFRTPPADSTGLPHILEHSVLCGSKHFPAKDPFVELVKGSLNTFLNAMTYPDKTVYPVASCNDKDFQNLMHVYLDAVFYPNIYEREEIFRQEGWHYELEDKDAPITINGVVYNEMKGAFSSPDDMLDREVFNTLFPDTAYSYESGGDPADIPTLSYEQFLDFHRRYYHPSNSYIYLYGDMDMEEKLTWLDQEYLSKFDALLIDSSIDMQKGFSEVVTKTKKYSITNEEPLEDNTYLSYNLVIDTSLNKELYLAFQIIEYALLLAPGAPLKQALLDKKIGKDIMSTYENGVLQPYFSVIAKNANKSDLDEFMNTIREVLSGIVKNGMDRKALLAGINFYEFKYREADFGSYPKGLTYGLQAYDSWLYDEKRPFMHIEANDTFAFIKSKVDEGYFEQLIQKYLLDNTHAAIVIVEPKRGLTAELDAKEAARLSSFKETLSNEQIEEMVQKTEALIAYQEEPSTKEELESIPLLQREDIKKEAEPFKTEIETIADTTVLHHNFFTNGIGYLNILFNIEQVPNELVPYLGILKNVLGFVSTEHYSYGDLFNEINMNSGGIYTGVTSYADAKVQNRFVVKFEIRAKVLYEKLHFVFEMIDEILFASNFDDDKRLYEIIAMLKSRLQMSMSSSGHSTAALRALSYCSETAGVSDMIGGLTFYRLIDKIESNFEEEKDDMIAKLKKLMHIIFRADGMLVDYTADEKGYSLLPGEIETFRNKLYTDIPDTDGFKIVPQKKNEGFKTASKVQYVAVAGNYKQAGLSYTGVLKVMKVILGYDYLWNHVRVKGGAYGCMSSFSKVGDSYMVSYRDPNLEKTIEVYHKAVDYLKNFNADEREMTKYIIGAISDMDIPLNPSAKGARSLIAYLTHETYEDIQRERDEVLHAGEENIRDMARYVEAVLKQNLFCVLGGEEKVEEQKALFDQIENLF